MQAAATDNAQLELNKQVLCALEDRTTTTEKKLAIVVPLVTEDNSILLTPGRARNKLRSALLEPQFLADNENLNKTVNLFKRFHLFEGEHPDDTLITMAILEKSLFSEHLDPRKRQDLLPHLFISLIGGKSEAVTSLFGTIHLRHLQVWRQSMPSHNTFFEDYVSTIKGGHVLFGHKNTEIEDLLTAWASEVIDSRNIKDIDHLLYHLSYIVSDEDKGGWIKELRIKEALATVLTDICAQSDICSLGLIRTMNHFQVKAIDLKLSDEVIHKLTFLTIETLLKVKPAYFNLGMVDLSKFNPEFRIHGRHLKPLIDKVKGLSTTYDYYGKARPVYMRLFPKKLEKPQKRPTASMGVSGKTFIPGGPKRLTAFTGQRSRPSDLKDWRADKPKMK